MVEERATAKTDRDKTQLYDELISNHRSTFYNSTKTNVYVAAAALGFYFKQRTPIPSGRSRDLFVTTTVGQKNKDRLWILRSIVIALEGTSALESMSGVISICDEYANYGIDHLYKIHKNSDDEIADLVDLMMDSLEKCGHNI